MGSNTGRAGELIRVTCSQEYCDCPECMARAFKDRVRKFLPYDIKIPEDPNARAHRIIRERLESMTDAERKAAPVCTGVFDYFPLALLAVAEVSEDGNRQHNPGEPLHWERSKSRDQVNTALRHLMQRGTFDGKVRHTAKAAWRILAALEIEIEEDLAAKENGK